jgi:hypothetical protein
MMPELGLMNGPKRKENENHKRSRHALTIHKHTIEIAKGNRKQV